MVATSISILQMTFKLTLPSPISNRHLAIISKRSLKIFWSRFRNSVLNSCFIKRTFLYFYFIDNERIYCKFKKHYQTHIQAIYIVVDLHYKISDGNPCIKCILDLYRRATQSLSPTHISCKPHLFISHRPSWPFPSSHSLWQEPWHYCKVHWVTNGAALLKPLF